MPKVAKPFSYDINKIISDHAKGKHPFKIPCSCCKKPCGNSTMDIFNARIKTYGSIEKLYKNYICTKCRKTKKITPIKEVTKTNEAVTEQGEKLCKDALGYMHDGRLDYFWRHKYYHLPSNMRTMIDTGDGYCAFVLTPEGEAAIKNGEVIGHR